MLGSTLAKLQCMEQKLDQARVAGTMGHGGGMGDVQCKIMEKILEKKTRNLRNTSFRI